MTATTTGPTTVRRRRPGPFGGRRGGHAAAGWLFVTPTVVILALFMVVPIAMALWVSVSDWGGRGNPFSGSANFVGLRNYGDLLTGGGLAQRDFATSMRNNAYYVLLVVPTQTVLSLLLAVLVNQKILKARGGFRTAFYFPSVTSSVAITVVFLFLFTASGAVNRVLAALSISGPNWIQDPRGVLHIILGALGAERAPDALRASPFLGLSWWDWLAGPSVALCIFIIMAIFTTSGTFMLLFLAALQNIEGEVEEAAKVDGASAWQRLRLVTVPMLRPTIFTVVTLGLIGTWQVFDQIYTGTRGAPGKTTLTPAFLSYQTSFISQRWGNGAAIAFILFAIIVTMTIVQRLILRERDIVPRRKRFVLTGAGTTVTTAAAAATAAGAPPAGPGARSAEPDARSADPGPDPGTRGTP